MGVNAAPRSTQIERVPEQGSARGFLEIERWSSEEDAITVRSGKGQHEDVRGQDAFFLHARGGYVDLISWGQTKKKRCHLVYMRMNKDNSTHPTRTLMPPPVPVTQPK
jgi:hypothetical protein